MPTQFYNDNANELAQQYLSKSFEEVHESWSQFLPSIIENPNARILCLSTASITSCVWSVKSLTDKYDIDHSMPFSRWPNNDLWNLLPTDCKINNQKSDRLPTELKLIESKERIQHWWQEAWLNDEHVTNRKSRSISFINKSKAFSVRVFNLSNKSRTFSLSYEKQQSQSQQKRFFAEANIALPGLSSDNTSIDDLLEALLMQRGRFKEVEQLRER